VQLAGVAAGTDKVMLHAYERFYAKFLCDYDGTGSIVEIGYGNGESVAFWKALYPSAYLYVIDKDIELNGEGFSVLKCDQSSAAQLDHLAKFLVNKGVALILDDGSHIPEHQLLTFNVLFQILRPGGTYIIEDLECSYWRYGDCYGYATRYGLASGRSLMNKLLLLPHWINRGFLSRRERKRWAKLLDRNGFRLTSLEGVAGVAFAQNCASISKSLDEDRRYTESEYRFAFNVEHNPRAVLSSFLPPFAFKFISLSYKRVLRLLSAHRT